MYFRSKVWTLPVTKDKVINSNTALGTLSEQFSLDVRSRQQFFRPSQQLVWIEQEGGGPLEKGLQERNKTVRLFNVFLNMKNIICLTDVWKHLENISDC